MTHSHTLRLLHILASSTLLVFLSAANATDQTEAKYEIEEMSDGLYRFTAGNYHSVFLVTEEGALVTDPINSDAAQWLKDEIATRFHSKIRYVVYSHNHVDHSKGGQAFAGEGVTFIAHRLARNDMANTKVDTELPDITFDDRLQIFLGGEVVSLRYHGVNNGRGSVSIMFEKRETLFVVDWIVLGRMPYRNLKGYDIQGMIDSTRDVLQMEFEQIIGGHADAGTKADVRRYLAYLEDLYAAVSNGMLEGKSLDALQAEIRLDKYQDFKMYEEWLPLNIEGVYRILNDMSYMDMR